MRDHLGVGLGCEMVPLGRQRFAQLAKILDDAVVNHRHPGAGMRMRVGLGGLAMRGPPGVADAGVSRQWRGRQQRVEVDQLARRPAPRQVALLQRRNACRIITAIFQPFQRLHDLARHRLPSQDANNSTHALFDLLHTKLAEGDH